MWLLPPPHPATLSAAKAADGTVWKLFSNLSNASAASSPAAEDARRKLWTAFALLDGGNDRVVFAARWPAEKARAIGVKTSAKGELAK